jgi:NADP-dependent 3-hydroxy acid dehydrogenase YdfG
MPELVDKVALITGAGSGIGQAIAIALAKASVRILIVGRNAAPLDALAAQVNAARGHAHVFTADLTQAEGRDAVAAWAIEEFGGVDLFVHSAGAIKAGCADLSDEDVDRMFQINVIAAHGLTARLLPSLVERKGQIVYINSRAGFMNVPKYAAYCATKWALKAYADGLRETVRAQGVRVISVYPGKVDTPLLQTLFSETGSPYLGHKYARPEDIANATMEALMVARHVEIPDVVVRPFDD